ncbi:hypothetical protein N7481_008732 [Penicillium waksmanii]|uniref:uncharacterized protein n=1 Tax=Penicillium waksmanii TaxID=69791 RepID=UPI0025475E57|nr:uncharacterized protein N7481_008732 [Penicillium waksmanii]KAJ5975025.1 hypothetical protein N7481_008732 [Penicillium waksmanii]
MECPVHNSESTMASDSTPGYLRSTISSRNKAIGNGLQDLGIRQRCNCNIRAAAAGRNGGISSSQVPHQGVTPQRQRVQRQEPRETHLEETGPFSPKTKSDTFSPPPPPELSEAGSYSSSSNGSELATEDGSSSGDSSIGTNEKTASSTLSEAKSTKRWSREQSSCDLKSRQPVHHQSTWGLKSGEIPVPDGFGAWARDQPKYVFTVVEA